MNYFELKQRIQDYTENTESTFVAEIDDFMRITEDRIFEALEMSLFRQTKTSTFTAGNKFLTTPEDYLNSISLTVTRDDGTDIALKKKHPTFVDDYIRNPTDVASRGFPVYYADYDAELYTSSSAGSTVQVGPVPDKAYPCKLGYYYKPASIADTKVFRSVAIGDSAITTGSAGSSTITVTDASHGGDEQTLVLLAGSAAVDGISASVINKALPHNIKTVTANAYEIDLTSGDTTAITGATTGSTSGGGLSVTAVYISGGTSWVGDNAESALFYGCMLEATLFMKGAMGSGSLFEKMEKIYDREIAALKNRYQGRGRMEERRYDNARQEPT